MRLPKPCPCKNTLEQCNGYWYSKRPDGHRTLVGKETCQYCGRPLPKIR